MYFLALSHAPPPEVIEIATNRPVTMTPSSMAPTAENAADLPAGPPPAPKQVMKYTTIGESTGTIEATILSHNAALLSMSPARPYSGRACLGIKPRLSR